MITLSSDFGSPYPAALKGVLLANSTARLVDVGHDFPRQDVRTTAFWLQQILPYFPAAVHLVVVDPGVGTERRVLVVDAGDHQLVGPDNGVLVPVATTLSDDPTYYATTPESPESSTFHGRDVFAPLAAMVHDAGIDTVVDADRFREVEDVKDEGLPEARIQNDCATGEVLAIDVFGNTITNVPGSFLDGFETNHILADGLKTPVVRTYANLPPGQRLVTVGSHGNVELAVNRGRGDDAFDLEVGDTVFLEPVESDSTDVLST